MSAKDSQGSLKLQDKGQWPNAWKIAAAVGGLGLLGTLAGFSMDHERIGYSFLFGYFATLTLLFGAMFLVIAQHVTQGHWGVSTRRIPELVMSGAPVMAVFGLVLLGGVAAGQFTQYGQWMGGHHGGGEHGAPAGEHHGANDAALLGGTAHAQEHGAEHAAAAEHGAAEHGADVATVGHMIAPNHFEEHAHHELLAKKASYLNKGRWLAFGIAYLVIWLAISFFFFRTSVKQDETKDKQLTMKMKFWAPLSAIGFFLTMTFAAFDWLMALEPAWYSTIFGVIIFGGSAVCILAFTILVGLGLSEGGHTGHAITTEHFHDLGKLMFGFMCFWTYVSFSQWMLIWYAGIPEEAVWYHRRWAGGWQIISMLLPIAHFALPFVFLISRVIKRNLGLLKVGAIWLLVMHVVDIYWFVMPHATEVPEFSAGKLWIDVSALLLVAGTFLAVVFKNMHQVNLVPVGDPRLSRSLHRHQTY